MFFRNALGSPLLTVKPILQKNIQKNEYVQKGSFFKITVLLLLMAILTFSLVWYLFYIELQLENYKVIAQLENFAFVSGIVALVLVFIAYNKPLLSFIIAPVYTVFSSIFIAGLSIAAEAKYPGIALMTVVVTIATFLTTLIAYKLRIVKITEEFKLILMLFIGSISVVYLLSFIMHFFNIKLPMIHEAGIGSVLWSSFIVVIAIMNLLVDFDRIEKLDENASTYMQYYAALGLMVSIVWLYISILRMLTKLHRIK